MINDNNEVPNPILRAHVSDHSFVLTLRKTHIATIASIAHCNRELSERLQGSPDFFISAVHGLMRRGLVKHQHQPPFAISPYPHKLTDFYRLTKAGWAVFDLLVEAGFVQPVENKSLRKRIA